MWKVQSAWIPCSHVCSHVVRIFVVEFVCAFLGGRVSQRSPRSSSFPQSRAFSLSSVCACVRVFACLCRKQDSQFSCWSHLCVLHYKDIRQRLRTVTFPCVRLAAAVFAAGRGERQRLTIKYSEGARGGGGACPDNSTHLYITKQLKGPRTTSCECVCVCVFSVNIQSVSPC